MKKHTMLVNHQNDFIRKQIAKLKKTLEEEQKSNLKLNNELRTLDLLCDNGYVTELDKFSKMLYNTNALHISKKMEDVDFEKILKIMPFWAAEIRHLGHVFPMRPDLFDLIVVDESSQVNLAEVIPAFYRGKKICIVGDHKQLSLNSTGVNFSLSSRFDTLTWNKHFGSKPSYAAAKAKKLTVTEASILDFIRSEANKITPKEVMLNEHFRSMPSLAGYTNKFYDDKLKIMTETSENVFKGIAFTSIKVAGKRNAENIIVEEARAVIDIIKQFTSQNDNSNLFKNDNILPKNILPENIKTIGVISMIRNHCEHIKELVDESIDTDTIEKYDIMCGTPEEFQGNERDLIIFSLCLDSECRGIGFYQNDNRLNVATSRAKRFTVIVYSEIPNSFPKIRSYLRYFEGTEGCDNLPHIVAIGTDKVTNITWKFDHSKYESEFEVEVYRYLRKYIDDKKLHLNIYNQVKACGQMRLDFVVYNPANGKSAAVEVDGSCHFMHDKSKIYSEEHLQRIEVLNRAGWNIINTPYYLWYKHGWLSDTKDKKFEDEIRRIYQELDRYILA
jgi:hypothetical protein